jgi:hypothetical protein
MARGGGHHRLHLFHRSSLHVLPQFIEKKIDGEAGCSYEYPYWSITVGISKFFLEGKEPQLELKCLEKVEVCVPGHVANWGSERVQALQKNRSQNHD